MHDVGTEVTIPGEERTKEAVDQDEQSLVCHGDSRDDGRDGGGGGSRHPCGQARRRKSCIRNCDADEVVVDAVGLVGGAIEPQHLSSHIDFPTSESDLPCAQGRHRRHVSIGNRALDALRGRGVEPAHRLGAVGACRRHIRGDEELGEAIDARRRSHRGDLHDWRGNDGSGGCSSLLPSDADQQDHHDGSRNGETPLRPRRGLRRCLGWSRRVDGHIEELERRRCRTVAVVHRPLLA